LFHQFQTMDFINQRFWTNHIKQRNQKIENIGKIEIIKQEF